MNDVMEPLIKENGAVNGTVEVSRQADGKWLAVPACVGSQIKGPCSRIDLMKKHAGIDVQAMYPAGAAPKADDWTTDTFLKAAEACHKGGVPVRHRARRDHRQRRHRRRVLPGVRRAARQRQGRHLVKTDEVRQALDYYKKLMAFLPPDVAGLGRRLQQQVAGVGPGRADHEPAQRLGGRQARRAAGRRAALDARLPGRARRAASRRSCRTSGASGTSPRTSRRPRACWSICRSRRRSRRWSTASGGYDLPSFEKLTTFKVWAEEGAAEGHALSLPEPAQPPDAVDRRVAGAAEDRPADLHPGHPDQDVRALRPGRSHGEDARLGGRRVRRLHAELTIAPPRSADCEPRRRSARSLCAPSSEQPAAAPASLRANAPR